jgi:hypothetical protein
MQRMAAVTRLPLLLPRRRQNASPAFVPVQNESPSPSNLPPIFVKPQNGLLAVLGMLVSMT